MTIGEAMPYIWTRNEVEALMEERIRYAQKRKG